MSNKPLSEIGKQQSLTKPFPALVTPNMGHLTLKMTFSIEEFIRRSTVFNRTTIEELNLAKDLEAQREERQKHTVGLARYALAGLMTKVISEMELRGEHVSQTIFNVRKELQESPYTAIQPVVTNLRDVQKDGSDLNYETPKLYSPEHANGLEQESFIFVMFLLSQKMSVVDGQHRRKAFELLLKWLQDRDLTGAYDPKDSFFSPSSGLTPSGMIVPDMRHFYTELLNHAMTSSFISVECHLGLSIEEEHQLFSDLNDRGLRVTKALSQKYNRADPVNLLVHELIDTKKLSFPVLDTDESDWHKDVGGQLRKDIHTVTSFAVLGKGSSKDSTPASVDKNRGIAERLWKAVAKAPHFGSAKSKTKTTLAQPVMLKAIAKLAHELSGTSKSGVRNDAGLKKLWSSIETGGLKFEHSNHLWGSLMLDEQARNKQHKKMAEYVFVPPGTNLDAGTVDPKTRWVRYGSKHNDIYRRLGDLIRLQLDLPPRPEVTRAIAKSKAGP